MIDTISRQAAIDALDEQIEQCDKALSSFDISMRDEFAVKAERASLVAFRETLEYLPSAEPQIIRCKDCKYAEYIDDVQSLWCTECGNGRTVAPYDFCSYGEVRAV